MAITGEPFESLIDHLYDAAAGFCGWHEVLEDIARIFEPLRLRSNRPAWTGSPDRNPSTIPPIEIPQEIRDRARVNGAPGAEEGEGGVVITPPGAGGDVHGDPVIGGSPGEPPAPPGSAS